MKVLSGLVRRYLAGDDAARTLQIAGLLRFTFIFLQGIVLIKAGVPVAVVGQLEMVFFIANFFQFFWQNGSHQAMMSWKSGGERPNASGAIFSAMHLQALLGAALVWLVAVIPVSGAFEGLLTGQNIAAISVYVFFSIPVGALTYTLLVRNRYGDILWYTSVLQGGQVVLVIYALVSGQDISTLVMLLAGYAILRWLVVLIVGRFLSHGIPARREVIGFCVFSIPLILHALNSGIMDYVDGWIVSVFYGDETFAQYRYGAREVPLNALMIGALVSGMVHRFRSANAIDSTTLRVETSRAIRLLFPLSCGLILFSPLLFQLLYSEDFLLSARVFNIYALTVIARVILSQVYTYVHRHNWVLTMSTTGEIIINVILSLLLMRWIGILGIPLATVVAYVLQKLFLIIYVRRRYGASFSEYVPVKDCVWYFSAMILCVILSDQLFF